ncbi:MAG: MFS transporter [Alphaproteobacteria bacterium]|nr:MFS transporter [Alphaproteobacteria bacterium]
MNTAEDELPLPQRYWAILNLAVGLALSVLDSAIANIALPAIAKELHASAADSIWVINAYQLAVVISLLPFASLGDIFGYRRIYIIGLVVFIGAALVSALSQSLLMLTLGRALQGLGAGGMMSVNTALVRFTYPRRQLGRGIAMVSVVVSVSSAAGPSVAAAILAVASWPWLFAINIPIGLVALAMSLRLLPYNPPSDQRFDLVSALLCAVSFALLISGINGIGHHHRGFLIVAEFAAAVLVGYALVRRQNVLAMPLLPIDLFKRPIFALSVATSVCSFVAQGIVFVCLPFYFQDVIGRSQVETGLLITPWPVTVAIIAPLAGRLADRYPAGILGAIGLSVLSLGFVLLALLPAAPADANIVWRIVICGLGFGFFQSPNNRAIISSAPRERSGGAGAVQSTARLLGQTIGAAMVALVFGFAGPTGGSSPTVAILLAAGFAAIAAVASISRMLGFVRRPRPARSSAPALPKAASEGVTVRSPP